MLVIRRNRFIVIVYAILQLVGTDLEQESGNMTLAWIVDQKTTEWTALIGPADYTHSLF